MSYFRTCCIPTPQPGLYYRQARRYSDNALVDLWLPIDSIPAGPGQFVFYSYDVGYCCKLVYTDAPSLTPGRIATLWDSLTSAAALALACSGVISGCASRSTLPGQIGFTIGSPGGQTYRVNANLQTTGPLYTGGSASAAISLLVNCITGTYTLVVTPNDGSQSQIFTAPANNSAPPADGWSGPPGWTVSAGSPFSTPDGNCNLTAILNTIRTTAGIPVSACNIIDLFGDTPDSDVGASPGDSFTMNYRGSGGGTFRFTLTTAIAGNSETCDCGSSGYSQVWFVEKVT